ncbi:MAG TPA: DUF4956 domain-containing protein [Gemmatimonadaceae bacterium]|jgi:hypothetical protein|nr:DUF4956 domain-containing protein [Gemmatimonadaceae bacterium]
MATASTGSIATPATRVLIRTTVYYVAVAALGALAWRYLPRTRLIDDDSLGTLFGTATETVRRAGKNAVVVQPVDQGTLAMTVVIAMISAMLVALPVAWIYTLTRAKRGYQQSVVHFLIILPVVIAGIVVMVRNSVALAFSLGGIAAAVRFRNSLDDSKDAAYVFLVLGIGIAAAIDVPVALVISVLFNAVIVGLWATDFGRTPVELEGRVAERRLQRARQLARTGTFVARIDDEVLSHMNAEQLDGLAQRAMQRAREHEPDGRARKQERVEARLRLRTRNGDTVLPMVEARLGESTKKWSVSSVSLDAEGVTVIEYTVMPKKSKGPDEILAAVRLASGSELVDAELK